MNSAEVTAWLAGAAAASAGVPSNELIDAVSSDQFLSFNPGSRTAMTRLGVTAWAEWVTYGYSDYLKEG